MKCQSCYKESAKDDYMGIACSEACLEDWANPDGTPKVKFKKAAKAKGLRRPNKSKIWKRFDALYKDLYAEVKEKYGHKCAECGSEKIGIHHIDGRHWNMVKENLVPLCWACHRVKHHTTIKPQKQA